MLYCSTSYTQAQLVASSPRHWTWGTEVAVGRDGRPRPGWLSLTLTLQEGTSREQGFNGLNIAYSATVCMHIRSADPCPANHIVRIVITSYCRDIFRATSTEYTVYIYRVECLNLLPNSSLASPHIRSTSTFAIIPFRRLISSSARFRLSPTPGARHSYVSPINRLLCTSHCVRSRRVASNVANTASRSRGLCTRSSSRSVARIALSSMQNPAPAPWCGEVACAASPEMHTRPL